MFNLLKGIISLSSLLMFYSASAVAVESTNAKVAVETNQQVESLLIAAVNQPERRFTCETFNGEWTVMYRPQGQSYRSYPWAVPGQLGGGWTASRRCQEISERLELYRPDGLLELQTGVQNDQEILCVTTQKNPSCRIVLTVPPDQNAAVTLKLVFQNLVLADSGQDTQGVNTFLSNISVEQILNLSGFRKASPSNINLLPFLHPTDGGTGTEL